jgi:hypothetical protein
MLDTQMIEGVDTVIFTTICAVVFCCLLVTGVLVEEICASCDDREVEELEIS